MNRLAEVNSELEIFYHYFMSSLEDKKNVLSPGLYVNGNDHDKLFNDMNIGAQIFMFMVDYYEKNGFPKRFSDKKWEALDGQVYYHGFKNYDFGANYLIDWNYHYGNGYMSGMYFSKDFDTALNFTASRKHDCVKDQVISAKLVDAKGVRLLQFQDKYIDMFFPKLEREDMLYIEDRYSRDNFKLDYAKSKLEKIKEPEMRNKIKDLIEFGKRGKLEEEFVMWVVYNYSALMVYLGYDYCIDDSYHDYMICFSRNKLAVKESDYIRMKYYSKYSKYPDFDTNFEK